jgi:hypothetical protein
MVSERDALPTTLDEAGAYRNLGARPVVVLTHGKPTPDMSRDEAEKFDKTWLEMQKDMATWSSHGTQRTVSDASHYIPNDDPDAVIAAIREVVVDVRSASHAEPEGVHSVQAQALNTEAPSANKGDSTMQISDENVRGRSVIAADGRPSAK